MRIPFTKFNLSLKKTNSNIIEIEKRILDEFIGTDSRFKGNRPQLNPQESMGDDQVLMPYVPIPMDIIYDTARYSDVLRTIHQNLRKEIFRKSYEITEVFAVKCEDCDKEFDQPVDECDECGSTNLREPDLKQKRVLMEFCKDVNDNGQDLVLVSENLNDDLETIDNAFLLMVKDYYWNNQGEKIGEVPVELIRCDPRFMYIMADKMGRPAMNQNGDHLLVCFEHRNTLLTNETKCPVCGRETFPANYRSQNPSGEYTYYNKNEVCHRAKYNPSLTYGFSVIYAVWMKVVTLMNMDQYMKNYYAKQRPPRGLLFVNTPNMDSLTKAWNWMLDEFRKNPHQIPPIAIEQTAGSKGNLVNFIDMMKGLDEMQYIECRNEMRRQIGAVYGVMPLFQGDISTSGGLNNEGLQITVTNRAIIDGQGVFNDGFYPWICKQMQITDYKIWLPPNEEEDLVHKEELMSKKIDNASKMQQMGFDVILNEEGDFEFDPLDEPVEKPDPMGGMMGGMPGQDEATQPDQEEPNQEPVPDGTPAAPEVASMQELGGEPPVASMTKSLKKGRVYLAVGQDAPEGAHIQQGKQGGRYYESDSSKKVSMKTIKDKDIDDMTDEEIDFLTDAMENSKTAYNAQDLETAKRWLSNKPHLRSKLGSKYYEFAVQVATAINEGYDPEEIDWASIDTEIPLADSLASMRYGELEASTKKGKRISGSLKKEKIYITPGKQPPQGVNVQQGPQGGRYYEDESLSHNTQTTTNTESSSTSSIRDEDQLNAFQSKIKQSYKGLDISVEYGSTGKGLASRQTKRKISVTTEKSGVPFERRKKKKRDFVNSEGVKSKIQKWIENAYDVEPAKQEQPQASTHPNKEPPKNGAEFVNIINKYAFQKIRNKDLAAKLIDEKTRDTNVLNSPILDHLSSDTSSGELFEKRPLDEHFGIFFVDIDYLSNHKGNSIDQTGKGKSVDKIKTLIEQGIKLSSIPDFAFESNSVAEGNHRVEALKQLGYKSCPVFFWGGWAKKFVSEKDQQKQPDKSSPTNDMKQKISSIAQESINENPEYNEEDGFSTGECANISDTLKEKLKKEFNIDSETVEVIPPRPGQVGSDHSAVYIPSEEMVVDTQLWQFEKDQRNGSKPKPLNERKWIIPKKEYEEMGYKIQK